MVIALYKCKQLWEFDFRNAKFLLLTNLIHLLLCLTFIVSITVGIPIFKWSIHESSVFTCLSSTCIMLCIFLTICQFSESNVMRFESSQNLMNVLKLENVRFFNMSYFIKSRFNSIIDEHFERTDWNSTWKNSIPV